MEPMYDDGSMGVVCGEFGEMLRYSHEFVEVD